MTTKDPRTGRFVSTANTPESREGKFATYTNVPVEFEGADPGQLAYGTEHRPAQADELAQGGSRFPVRGRHPVLVSLDEEARTRHGTQGMLTRDAARLQRLTGMLAAVLGVDDTAGPPGGVMGTTDDECNRGDDRG